MKPITILFCCLFSLNALSQDLNSALKLINSEQYEEAEKMLTDLIKKEPANGDLYYHYGVTLLKYYLADTFSISKEEFVGKAESVFQNGIQQAPANVLNHIGMGAITLLRTNDTTKADVYFDKADLAVPPKLKKKDYTPAMATILTQLALGQLFGSNNRFDKALEYLNRAKVINPEDPSVYLALGEVYIRMNDASNALVNFNQALNKDPKSPLPKIKIGNIYMRVPNLTAARPYFEEAQQIDSTFAPVYRSLGELWTLAGRHDLAKQYYYKFMQLSGNTTPAKVRYSNSLYRAKNYAEAVDVIEEVLKVDNSRNYLNRIAGYSCYDKKPQDLEKARTYMETFFKNAKPENIITRDYTYYGRILYKQAGRDSILLDKAFENLKKAYSMDENDKVLLAEIGTNYYYSRRYKEAIEIFELKAQKGWASPADPIMIARSYYNMQDFQKADEAFAKITTTDPKNIDALLWYARTASKIDPDFVQGLAAPRFENMIAQIGMDIDKNKNALQEAFSYFGYYHMNRKEYDLAKAWYERMYNLDEKNKDWRIAALTGFASIAYKEKDFVVARDNFQKILELDPNNAAMQQAVKDLTKVINASQK